MLTGFLNESGNISYDNAVFTVITVGAAYIMMAFLAGFSQSPWLKVHRETRRLTPTVTSAKFCHQSNSCQEFSRLFGVNRSIGQTVIKRSRLAARQLDNNGPKGTSPMDCHIGAYTGCCWKQRVRFWNRNIWKLQCSKPFKAALKWGT